MKIHSMVKIKAEKGEWCLLLSKEVFPDRGLFERGLKGVREVSLGSVLKMSVPGRGNGKCKVLRQDHA